MADIYEQHTAAFAVVSAFVVLDREGERVATVAIKFPRDGAGRLYAYVHLIGVPMVRGHANGYGYDKRSAAVSAAIAKVPTPTPVRTTYDAATMKQTGEEFADYHKPLIANRAAFIDAARAMDGDDWTRALEKQGFRVLQAV